MQKGIIITTTNLIDGAEITQYLGIVNESIVVGTNLFSDLFAGVSDIFGGKSKSYQKELQDLYSYVLDGLIDKAKVKKADAIVGLKIDFDELSGQGKSMFMMNAIGTAVKTIQTNSHPNNQIANRVLDRDEFEKNKKILQIKEKIRHGEQIEEADFQFILANRIPACEKSFYTILNNPPEIAYNNNLFNFYRDLFIDYIGLFPYSQKIEMIYPYIEKYENLGSAILELIKEFHIINFSYVKDAITSRETPRQHFVLNFIGFPNESYTPDNIEDYKEIISLIKENIAYNYDGSTPNDKWECSCGKKNSPDKQYCSKCLKDVYGFTRDEINPTQAIESIQEIILILESSFESR